MQRDWPLLGCGAGLRSKHYPVITSQWPAMEWFEAITENYMDSGGRPFHILEEVRKHYPVALHGVSLSIGSTDSLHPIYLDHLKKLVERIDPVIVSDHLCWSGVDGKNLHDLLPLPFTEESITHIARRVEQVQELLGRRILLENVSSYVTYKHSTIPEWEFLREVALRSGCGILLDINNIYVNAYNHKFDAREYIRNIPAHLVGQFHLAGHTNMGDYLFDTHSKAVIEPVWELYREALSCYGQVSTLIEWDEDIPEFETLCEEVARARKIYLSFRGAQRREISEPRDFSPPAGVRNDEKSAPSLREIQHEFRVLAGPDGDAAQAGEIPLNPQAGTPGIERISVYAHGYHARLLEALTEVYVAVKHVLGEKIFSNLAHTYSERYPSQDYNLSLAGRFFPEFLKDPAVTGEMPFLPDLAELEWRVASAFHAYDRRLMDPSGLSNLDPDDWEKIKIIFQPSVSVMHSEWPVFDVWRVRNEPVENIKIDMINRPQDILVFRRGFETHCMLLDSVQFRMLEGLLAGKTLGQMCEALIDEIDGESPAVSGWFSSWLGLGLLAGCEIPSKNIRA